MVPIEITATFSHPMFPSDCEVAIERALNGDVRRAWIGPAGTSPRERDFITGCRLDRNPTYKQVVDAVDGLVDAYVAARSIPRPPDRELSAEEAAARQRVLPYVLRIRRSGLM